MLTQFVGRCLDRFEKRNASMNVMRNREYTKHVSRIPIEETCDIAWFTVRPTHTHVQLIHYGVMKPVMCMFISAFKFEDDVRITHVEQTLSSFTLDHENNKIYAKASRNKLFQYFTHRNVT